MRKTSKTRKAVQILGDVVAIAPTEVKPNTWNPNRMTSKMFASLKTGLVADGWLKSMSMLVWGLDRDGVRQNIIIDGEHRWKAAIAIGMPEVPVVFLDGISEAQAKALTIKMDQKRGAFDATKLKDLVNDIFESAAELGLEDVESFADNLGFDGDYMEQILNLADYESGGGTGGPGGVEIPAPSAPLPRVEGEIGRQPKMRIPLVFFIPVERHAEFKAFFKHPTLETELNNELFEAIVTAHRASAGV